MNGDCTCPKFRVELKSRSFELSRRRMVSLHADRQFRLIYVCNPKSGCTTIMNVLFYCDRGFSYFEPEQIHSSYYAFWKFNRHNYSDEVVNLFNRNDVYVFSVTRHPLHRFISGFVDKLLPRGQDSYFDARDFLCGYVGIDLAGDPARAAVAFLDWLERDELPNVSMSDPHFRRQVDNLALGSNFPVDFIGKIEEPEPILDMFERITGLRPAEMLKQRRRVTNHPAKHELLNSAKVRAAVERVYEPDFRAFGYW
jgi:Sulfotransferase family